MVSHSESSILFLSWYVIVNYYTANNVQSFESVTTIEALLSLLYLQSQDYIRVLQGQPNSCFEG